MAACPVRPLPLTLRTLVRPAVSPAIRNATHAIELGSLGDAALIQRNGLKSGLFFCFGFNSERSRIDKEPALGQFQVDTIVPSVRDAIDG